MESLQKEILAFEESRCLLESRIHELEERLRDSSRVKFDLEARSEKLDNILGTVQIKGDMGGIGFRKRVVPIPPARVRNTRKVRKGPHIGNHFHHRYTWTFFGRKDHLRRYCYDLRQAPRKFRNKVAPVPHTHMRRFTPTWVRKSDLVALGIKHHDSRLGALDSSHAKSKG